MSDEPGAIEMYVPESITFNSTDATFLVVHKTAGFSTAQQCAEYFGNLSENTGGASSHYIVGLDGTIVQCVPEARGAGANCCVEPGHADFLPNSWDGHTDNGNLHSISIEHIDPSTDNSTVMPPAQVQASFQLVKHICQRHNIPMRAATNDGQGGIIGHNQIDPESRARCPGPTYPFGELWSFLNIEEKPVSSIIIPESWTDDGNKLTSPNGGIAEQGFRAFFLNYPGGWDPRDWIIRQEYHRDPWEDSNPAFGSGAQIMTLKHMIAWTPNGAAIEYVGKELDFARQEVQRLQAELASMQPTALQQQVTDLQKKIDQARQALQ